METEFRNFVLNTLFNFVVIGSILIMLEYGLLLV